MIYIHENRIDYIQKYAEILKANSIPFEYINCQDHDFWDKIKEADLFLHYLNMGPAEMLMQHHLISIIDKVLKVPCYPDWATAWHYDDKVAEIMLLQSKGYPIVDSWVFWEKDKALKWAKNTDYPVVFKLKNGAASINVIKVDSFGHARKLINQMFGKGIINNRMAEANLLSIYRDDFGVYLKRNLSYLLDRLGMHNSHRANFNREKGYAHFQRFIPDNAFDTRIHVFGDAAFGSRRLNRKKDFRASGAGRVDFSPEGLRKDMVEISHKIATELNFQAMTFDFLIDKDGRALINEIGCQCADWAPHKFPGYWDRRMQWHEGRFWPQYIMLRYLLKREDLIQPEFEEVNPKGFDFTPF